MANHELRPVIQRGEFSVFNQMRPAFPLQRKAISYSLDIGVHRINQHIYQFHDLSNTIKSNKQNAGKHKLNEGWCKAKMLPL